MSWDISDIEHRRMDFVLIAREPEVSMSEACRQFEVSRKTGYKWLRRYKEHGLSGLANVSRRPRSSPLQVSGDVAIEIINLRDKHKSWGPKKLQERLTRSSADPNEVPSVATIGRILRRSGQSEARGRGRPHRCPPTDPLSKAQGPNDVWTVDFKGWWQTRDGKRCEPLSIRDLYSRYILCLRPVLRRHTDDVRRVFEEVFERYGLPSIIRSDNGGPFASMTGPHGLTQLSAWWRSIGIKLERIAPGHPEQNGGHERMHRDLAKEIQEQPGATVAEETQRLERWRVEFNLERPHEALAMKLPGEVYHRSGRNLRDAKPYVYPLDFTPRHVRRDGCILINGQSVYLSQALGKMYVGLERLSATGWRVWFCDLIMSEIYLDGDHVLRRAPSSETKPATQDCNPCPDNKVLPMCRS
jgi:putative transposase